MATAPAAEFQCLQALTPGQSPLHDRQARLHTSTSTRGRPLALPPPVPASLNVLLVIGLGLLERIHAAAGRKPDRKLQLGRSDNTLPGGMAGAIEQKVTRPLELAAAGGGGHQVTLSTSRGGRCEPRLASGVRSAAVVVLAAREPVVPVLITSITTNAGLAPSPWDLPATRSPGGLFLAMAIVWGCSSSTLLPLVFVAPLYLWLPPKPKGLSVAAPQPKPGLRALTDPARR